MKVSVVCPVLDHPEFIDGFADATRGADEVVIVDTGSQPENRALWAECGTVIDYGVRGHNYGHWCNAGYAHCCGDVVIFLNNDIHPTGDWLANVRRDVESGAIYGPELLAQLVDGIKIPYLSGWCIAATDGTWGRIREAGWHGPWNTIDYPAAGYWEDNDLCFRALQAGITLQQTRWPIAHLDKGNGTSRHNQAYYADVARNKATFAASVRRAMYAAV